MKQVVSWGAFCRISHMQQLSQHKRGFSGMLVVPAGLSLGSLNKRSRTNYQNNETRKTDGRQEREGGKTRDETVTLICSLKQNKSGDVL